SDGAAHCQNARLRKGRLQLFHRPTRTASFSSTQRDHRTDCSPSALGLRHPASRNHGPLHGLCRGHCLFPVGGAHPRRASGSHNRPLKGERSLTTDSIETATSPPMEAKGDLPSPQRTIGLLGATTVGMSAIVGGGILVLAGAAFQATGPGAIVAFALNGVIAVLTALSFAEMSTRFPESGGAYNFAKRVLSVRFAFAVGWVLWFAYIVAGVLYALGFAR